MALMLDFTVAGVTVQPGEIKPVTVVIDQEVLVSCRRDPPAVVNVLFRHAGRVLFTQQSNAEGYMERYWIPDIYETGTNLYWCYGETDNCGFIEITVISPPEVVTAQITDVSHKLVGTPQDEIEIVVTFKNTSTITGGFTVFLYDENMGLREKEPKLFPKSVGAGATSSIKLSSDWDPMWDVYDLGSQYTVELHDKDYGLMDSWTVVFEPGEIPPPAPQEVDTTLSMKPDKVRPMEGEIVTFTGRLTRADTGAGLADQLITILDGDVLWDDPMGSGYTDVGGNYSIEWYARRMDPLRATVDAFAGFEGAEIYNPSESIVTVITIGEEVAVSVTVTVDDAETGDPIMGAEARLAEQMLSTDAGGTAIFRDVPGNEIYTLSVSKEGYAAKTTTVVVGSVDETVNVSLTPGVPPVPPCAIATAAYGSPLAPELGVFRTYRDEVLLQNRIGRLFVRIYYLTSPPVAKILAKNETLRIAVRNFLGKILERIK